MTCKNCSSETYSDCDSCENCFDDKNMMVLCPTCKEDGVILFTEKEHVDKYHCCPDCLHFRRRN